METASAVILELPNDVLHAIFTYCGDVARAASCSVSSRWYKYVLDVSKSLSAVPEMYAYARVQYTLNKAIAVDILSDYHLTVRISGGGLFDYQQQLCIAGNQSVCELAMDLGLKIYPTGAILSRNKWFHEKFPADFAYMWGKDILRVILKLLKYNRNDTLLEYFGDNKYGHFMPEIFSDRTRLATAVVKSADIRIVRWLVQYDDKHMNHILLFTIVELDAVELIETVIHLATTPHEVCRRGSIAMFTHVYTSLNQPLDQLIKHAFEADNLVLFEHMLSLGASTDHLDFIDGLANGALKCSLRIRPKHVNTRDIITCIAVDYNVKLSELIEHFQFSQEDFNYGLCTCIEEGNDPSEFVDHANNYDIALYKRYGAVVINNDVPVGISNDVPVGISNDVPVGISNDVPVGISNDTY